MIFIESSLSDLYSSAVLAFPNTTKRQHAVQPIEITKIRWTPFLGVRTLMAKGTAKNEGREYDCFIIFKNVQYHENRNRANLVQLVTENRTYFLEKLSSENTQVLVRCSCNDFKYRFKYYDHLDRSLFGHKGKKYISAGGPPANPLELEGVCKHIMKFSKVLTDVGVVQ